MGVIDKLRADLADMAFSKDLTLAGVRNKAARLYWDFVLLNGTPDEQAEAREALAEMARRREGRG